MPRQNSTLPSKALTSEGLLGVFLLAALGMASSPAYAGGDAEKIAEICAKADARYKEMFPDAKAEPGVQVVKMYKYTFCPPDLTVKAGTTLRYVNVEKRTSHSVWYKEDGKPESDRLFPEETVEIKLNKIGKHTYLCGPHWEKEDMIGKVRVSK